MGCFIAKDTPYSVANTDRSEVPTARGSLMDNKLFIGQLSREITTVDEFRLSNSNFIGRKQGIIHKDYTLLDPPIGKGAFGEVRRAIHIKTNLTRAVKIIYKDNTNHEEQERIVNEVNILKTLDHPNIMKIIEFYQDEDHFYIVTEYFNGGELFEKISDAKNFGEIRAAKTIRQIVSAINYMHQRKIAHRDLKPENILYATQKEDSLVKIIDFGTSRHFNPTTVMKQKFGTPYYIAPEVIKKKYDEKCDIWSCGVILYILLSGTPPFMGANPKETMKLVLKGEYDFNGEKWSEVSDLAIDLIKNMLTYEPEKRYSAEQVLSHPWFNMLGEQKVDRPSAISTLAQLRRFKSERKLQQAIWLFLVSYVAPKEDRDQMLKMFQELDLNGDGLLSREELLIAYRQFMDCKNPEGEVDAIFKAVDYDNSGNIEYTEFIMATVNRHNWLSNENLDLIFKLIDTDGNGYLDLDEIKEVLNPNDYVEIDIDVWKRLIEEVDEDGDGKISYQEFTGMMRKFLDIPTIDSTKISETDLNEDGN